MNPNMRSLRLAVDELNGKIVSSRSTGKHWLVIIKTDDGRTIRATLSKGPMREGHVRFWIRQKFQQKGRVK